MVASRLIMALLGATLIGVGASPCRALTFKRLPTTSGAVIIIATGEIEPGDSLKLDGFLEAVEGSQVIGYALNSPGGNIVEAEKVAAMIHDQNVSAAVSSGSMCASACFLLFAAASHRIAAPDALIGVHSASNSDGEEDGGTLAMTTALARDASAYNVPAQIVGELVTTKPGAITWLDVNELSSMGVQFLRPNPSGMPSQQPVEPTVAAASRSANPWASQQARPSKAVASIPNSSPLRVSGDTASIPPAMSRSFVAGLSDRKAWESWFAALSPGAHEGAAFWASQRSLKHPQACMGDSSAMSQDWITGCQRAAEILAPLDARRHADPDYKKGWNSI